MQKYKEFLLEVASRPEVERPKDQKLTAAFVVSVNEELKKFACDHDCVRATKTMVRMLLEKTNLLMKTGDTGVVSGEQGELGGEASPPNSPASHDGQPTSLEARFDGLEQQIADAKAVSEGNEKRLHRIEDALEWICASLPPSAAFEQQHQQQGGSSSGSDVHA